MTAISVRIRQAREAAGLSQEALAEAVGVTKAEVSQWEREGNPATPAGPFLAMMGGKLGVHPEWLASGTGRATTEPSDEFWDPSNSTIGREFHLARWKANQENGLEGWKVGMAVTVESNNATIALGLAALKAAMIVNGAAAAAVLAFIGHIWTSALGRDAPVIAAGVHSLTELVTGVAVGALATGTAYVTQYCYTRALWKAVPHQGKKTPAAKAWNTIGIGFHVATVGLVVFALLCFWWGVSSMTAALGG